MSALAEQITKFIGELRAAGVRISVAETIDAMHAVIAAGIARERMREALAAALIKDEADRAAFDAAFDRFFAAPRRARGEHPEQRGAQVSAAAGRGRPGENPAATEDSTPRKNEEVSGAVAASPQGRVSAAPPASEPQRRGKGEPRETQAGRRTAAAEAVHGEAEESEARGERREAGIAGARMARMRAIERLPFDLFTDDRYEEARAALAPLVRRFRIRLGRRLRLAKAGRVDFRRTIRAAVQRGGALIDLKFRSRRPRHVDLLILADISGSVRYAAQLMLELIAGARGCFRRVSSFVYVDHLAEAEFEQGHLVMTPALDLYARSDFGRVLGELWQRRSELITRATLMVIMGDGRNNRLPARADVVREIARMCRGVVWLNPEDPARWGTGDSAIRQYEREVNALVAARNLKELESALMRVA